MAREAGDFLTDKFFGLTGKGFLSENFQINDGFILETGSEEKTNDFDLRKFRHGDIMSDRTG